MEFITIQEVKTISGISSANEDATLALLVPGVNNLLTKLLDLDELDYSFTKLSTDSMPLFLETKAAVVDIVVKDSEGNDLPGLTGSNGKYRLDNVYVGDFSVTIPPRFTTVPADLKLAAHMLVKYYRKEEYKASQSANGQAVTNVPTVHNVPRHIMSIIALYRPI